MLLIGCFHQKFLTVLEKTGEGMLEITLIASAAGLILGVVSITGLGFSFSVALIQMSGGSFLILLVLAAAGAIGWTRTFRAVFACPCRGNNHLSIF